MEQLINELYEKLKQKGLLNGIKEHLIEDKDDYFKQAVIIVCGLEETEENAKLITDIDIIFMNNGYKPYDFVNAVANYKKELEELYKKMRSL